MIKGLRCIEKGSNIIEISHENKYVDCRFLIGSNNRIVIHPSKHVIANLHVWCANNTSLIIGKDFSCCGGHIRLDENSKNVVIGDDVMFSGEICIYTTDGHAIFDCNNLNLLNSGMDVLIGNHVWIGRRVCLLKGSIVSDNSVVGFSSLITKKFKEGNVVIAGNPARVIKKKINWARTNPSYYKKDSL